MTLNPTLIPVHSNPVNTLAWTYTKRSRLGTRLYGIFFTGIPLGILIALYALIMPAKKKGTKMIFKKMFSRAWLITTLLVFLGSAICIRLGIWQLDRLKQRRAFNAQVISMRAEELLDLNQNLPADISAMEWRAVTVTGEYDFENQVALRNQYNGDQYGYHLITPLLFSGGAVLVDRGWIPADGNAAPNRLAKV